MSENIHLFTAGIWELWLKPDGSQYYVSIADNTPRYGSLNTRYGSLNTSRNNTVNNIIDNFKRWQEQNAINWINEDFKDYFGL